MTLNTSFLIAFVLHLYIVSSIHELNASPRVIFISVIYPSLQYQDVYTKFPLPILSLLAFYPPSYQPL